MSQFSDSLPASVDVYSLCEAYIRKDAEALPTFFEPDAVITLANTNEVFTPAEYVRAVCENTVRFEGQIEDIRCISRVGYYTRLTLVAKIWDSNGRALRVVSFIELSHTENELIQYLTEYWGKVTEPPEWRKKAGIGTRFEDSPVDTLWSSEE